MKYRTRWLFVEPQLIWCTFIVLGPALLIPFLPGVSERSVRIAGWALEVLGMATVAWGIHTTRKQFGEASFTAMVRDWWKRRHPPGAISGSAHMTLGGAAEANFAGAITVGPRTVEERLARIERDLHLLTRRIDTVANDIRNEKQERRDAIATETHIREQKDAEIQSKMQLFATGGIYVSTMGLVWLVFGLTLSTVPNEIVGCINWTADCPLRW
jgi:hypothetical protein